MGNHQDLPVPALGLPVTAAPFVLDGGGDCPGCPQHCTKRVAPVGVDSRAALLHQEGLPAVTNLLRVASVPRALAIAARAQELGVDVVAVAGTLAALQEAAAAGLDVPPGVPAVGDGHLLERVLVAAADERSTDPLSSALRSGAAGIARTRPWLAHLLLHVKGVELGVFDLRASTGMALAAAVHPCGPRYDAVEHDIDTDPVAGRPSYIARSVRFGCPPEGLAVHDASSAKVALTAELMALWSGLDALGVCVFAAPPTRPLEPTDVVDLVRATVGWDLHPEDLGVLGRRRLQALTTLARRAGVGPGHDRLPARCHTPVALGPWAGAALPPPARFGDLTAELRARLGLR